MVAGICALLAAAVWIVFGQTVHHDFVNYDDDVYVYQNPHVKSGLTRDNIAWAFTHRHDAMWHPLTSLSHMADCQIYGLNPGGHHFTSVLLHTATAILLFLVLRGLTSATWPSAFVAALFAVHPLHVESVAWVAERKDVLSGFFFVLALGAYARFARKPGSMPRYLLVLFAFALGLMSKPMLVTFPFVLLLLDYWPLYRSATRLRDASARQEGEGRSAKSDADRLSTINYQPSTLWRLLIEKIPLLLLSAVVCLITLRTQINVRHQASVLTFGQRLGNAIVSCATYLGQFFYPAKLAVFYPFPFDGLPAAKVAFALLVLLGISALAIWLRRKCPYLIFGWLWYLGMLVPVIGLIQVGSQAHADRYTYLPLIGVAIAFTWAITELTASWRNRTPVLAVGAAFVLSVLVAGARAQTAFWQDSETLWVHTLQCTSDTNALAQSNLGNFLYQKGRLDEAMEHCQKALDIWPDDAGANNCLGFVLLQKGRVDDAMVHFNTALQIRPDYAPAHNNLGMALYQTGHYDEAIAHFESALATDPDLPDAHNNLGAALVQTGHPDEAVGHYEKALELKPDYPGADNNLAWVLATSPKSSVRNGARAVEFALKANQLAAGNLTILRTLAAAYAEAGRFPEAIDTATQAFQLAASQNNAAFVNTLQREISLYQSGQPLRDHVPVR